MIASELRNLLCGVDDDTEVVFTNKEDNAINLTRISIEYKESYDSENSVDCFNFRLDVKGE